MNRILGFTLLEVLIAISIFSICILSLAKHQLYLSQVLKKQRADFSALIDNYNRHALAQYQGRVNHDARKL